MTPIRQARFEMLIVRTEVEKTGASYRYALVSREILAAPDWLRARMNLQIGGGVVHLVCFHSGNGEAFQLEDRWINATALPQAFHQDFTVVGPNEWLIATASFSEVEISFLAAAADAINVPHFDHKLGEPVFCVERATWWQNAAITLVTLSHRRGYRNTTRY